MTVICKADTIFHRHRVDFIGIERKQFRGQTLGAEPRTSRLPNQSRFADCFRSIQIKSTLKSTQIKSTSTDGQF